MWVTLRGGLGCDFSKDTDAHAPGQLDSQDAGARAVECGVPADRVINTLSGDALPARTHG